MAGLLFLAGCSSFNAVAPQTQVPGIVETIVAATSAASRAETAAVLPPITATSSVTPTSTNTLIPTVTFTSTPTYIVSLFTPLATTTPLSGTGIGIVPAATATPIKFGCNFVSQTPLNGTIMKPRQDFDWHWTVSNDAIRLWQATEVRYVYIKGDKFHRTASYAIPADVPVGESAEFIVDMEAPKEPGSYFTTWALQKEKITFCIITLQIRVR